MKVRQQKAPPTFNGPLISIEFVLFSLNPNPSWNSKARILNDSKHLSLTKSKRCFGFLKSFFIPFLDLFRKYI